MENKLLIVDDQPGIRLLLKDVFTSEGYEVRTAKTGQEALDKIQNSTFHLIILDYRLPILNGKEVIAQMERNNILTPVILMSGSMESLNRELISDRKAVELVAKPFNIKEISELVHSMLL